MNEPENKVVSALSNPLLRIGLFLLLLLIAIILFTRGNGGQATRAIKPLVATQTPGPLRIDTEPTYLTFDELETNPRQYRNQKIEVIGLFTLIHLPDCRPYSGPQTEWGLINGSLQMNALGYEDVVRTLPDQIELQVLGIWRFYPGPVGCGKESQAGKGVWYLEVLEILQPNPLPLAQRSGTIQLQTSDGTPIATVPTLGENAGDDLETPNPNTPDLTTPTATATPANDSTTTSTPTSDGTNGTATSTPTRTPTATATVQETAVSNQTSTPTRTPSITATAPSLDATPTSGGSGPPAAATATTGSGGYPPPPSANTPSATGYP